MATYFLLVHFIRFGVRLGGDIMHLIGPCSAPIGWQLLMGWFIEKQKICGSMLMCVRDISHTDEALDLLLHVSNFCFWLILNRRTIYLLQKTFLQMHTFLITSTRPYDGRTILLQQIWLHAEPESANLQRNVGEEMQKVDLQNWLGSPSLDKHNGCIRISSPFIGFYWVFFWGGVLESTVPKPSAPENFQKSLWIPVCIDAHQIGK